MLPQEKTEEESQLFFHMHFCLFPKPRTPPAASKLASKASEPQNHFLSTAAGLFSFHAGTSQGWRIGTLLPTDLSVPPLLDYSSQSIFEAICCRLDTVVGSVWKAIEQLRGLIQLV